MDVIGDTGVDFRDIGKLLKIMMFENCVISKNLSTNYNSYVLGSKDDYDSTFREGRRAGRCPLKIFRALKTKCLNSGIGFCTFVPRPARGGGGF